MDKETYHIVSREALKNPSETQRYFLAGVERIQKQYQTMVMEYLKTGRKFPLAARANAEKFIKRRYETELEVLNYKDGIDYEALIKELEDILKLLSFDLKNAHNNQSENIQ